MSKRLSPLVYKAVLAPLFLSILNMSAKMDITSAQTENATNQAQITRSRRHRIGDRETIGASLAMPRPEALEHRLARVQAQIDQTMDADMVTRLNAEYARLQRELDERDMAKVRAVSNALEGR